VRRDFVANVSHELRTPLTIVGGFAETLQDASLPPDRRAQFATRIVENTRRMQRIVDELLDLSRIESGHWQPNPQEVRVADVAREVFDRVSESARANGIALETRIAADAEVIAVDRTAIEQILINLVENALRHTAQGRIAIETHREAGGMAVLVRDTGTGILPEHVPRVFERFYRADRGRSREAGGTGLGLAIVKHLVEAHGGAVSAQSTVGSGTTIRLFFPNPPVTTES
jgi:two-component system phosphate regulon sensor histidine kinase PhoR